jgi:hypothetical protein
MSTQFPPNAHSLRREEEPPAAAAPHRLLCLIAAPALIPNRLANIQLLPATLCISPPGAHPGPSLRPLLLLLLLLLLRICLSSTHPQQGITQRVPTPAMTRHTPASHRL